MGTTARFKPQFLAEKLQRIRLALGLSQDEILVQLGIADEYFRSAISKFELGTREPNLIVLLRYARLANVYVEALIDDELDLPPQIPSSQRHEGIPRKQNKHPHSARS
jgi:transcriptional regulator with XRE-family HTH domain